MISAIFRRKSEATAGARAKLPLLKGAITMEYIYTATFTASQDGSKYYARVPDLPGCITTGHSLQDAIDMITDAACGWLVVAEDEGLSIPEPTAQKLVPQEPDAICSLIRCDTIRYRAETDTKAVRKNVSLPAWMVNLADKRGINCSQVLQEALRVKLDPSQSHLSV
jgi:predicted RNase H-like HicB family nuclease